jgi:TRAP-type uncharacterized transport system fused permease subunit
VAISAYVAAGIAKAPMAKTGWIAFRLGLASFIVPYAFVYSQRLLLIGDPFRIVVAVLSGLIGVYALAVASEGYWSRHLNAIQRVIALGAAVVMIVPGWQTDVIGIAALAMVFVWQKWLQPKELEEASSGGEKKNSESRG